MARAVASAANPRWYDDVLARKLCVAVGQGVVHGRAYNLMADFGVDYTQEWEAL
jgi:hypothetical protein